MNFDCLIIDDEKMLADSTAEYFNLFGVKTAVVKFLRIVCLVQMCISDDYGDSLLIKNHRQQHRASSIYRQIRPIEKSTVYKAMLRNQVNQRFP